MQEKQLEIAGGILYYELAGEKVHIVGYQGSGARVEVPAEIEGCPVTGIGKKAFLSKKSLHSIILPAMVEEIGDWAFAYCGGLVQISFPYPDQRIRFGKAVFKECERLERIEIRIPREEYGRKRSETVEQRKGLEAGISEKGIPELLAAAVRVMDAYYLLDLSEAGSVEWLAKWDARLAAMLQAPDQEGYSKQVLCGEEDYGSTDLDAFTSNRRKEKVRLAFLRLLYPLGLSVSGQAQLEDYLRRHTKGQPGEEAWLVLLQEHGDDREYYEMFSELSCINRDNFDAILMDIGDGYPEMKAFFMRLQEGQVPAEDFFAALEL